jgi:hypothetical protein
MKLWTFKTEQDIMAGRVAGWWFAWYPAMAWNPATRRNEVRWLQRLWRRPFFNSATGQPDHQLYTEGP